LSNEKTIKSENKNTDLLESLEEEINQARKNLNEWLSFTIPPDPWNLQRLPKKKSYVNQATFLQLERIVDNIMITYPQWYEYLQFGFPSYYGVLGVRLTSSPVEIERAYEQRYRLGIFPADVLDDAYETLIDSESRKQYNRFLKAVKRLYNAYESPDPLGTLLSARVMMRGRIKDRAMTLYAKQNHYRLIFLVKIGFPSFYKITGIDKIWSAEKIKSEAISKLERGIIDSTIKKEIIRIIANPVLKVLYDKVRSFYTDKGNPLRDTILQRQKYWEYWEDLTEIIIPILQEIDRFSWIERWHEVKENTDWMNHIPPDEPSFFDILGIDPASLPDDDKKVESILRENYRKIKRTQQVNLAYTTLKRKKKRNDYLWLLDNYPLLKLLDAVEELAVEETAADHVDELLLSMMVMILKRKEKKKAVKKISNFLVKKQQQIQMNQQVSPIALPVKIKKLVVSTGKSQEFRMIDHFRLLFFISTVNAIGLTGVGGDENLNTSIVFTGEYSKSSLIVMLAQMITAKLFPIIIAECVANLHKRTPINDYSKFLEIKVSKSLNELLSKNGFQNIIMSEYKSKMILFIMTSLKALIEIEIESGWQHMYNLKNTAIDLFEDVKTSYIEVFRLPMTSSPKKLVDTFWKTNYDFLTQPHVRSILITLVEKVEISKKELQLIVEPRAKKSKKITKTLRTLERLGLVCRNYHPNKPDSYFIDPLFLNFVKTLLRKRKQPGKRQTGKKQKTSKEQRTTKSRKLGYYYGIDQ